MTTDERNKIVRMRKSGIGYATIAQELGLSKNTVKTFCRRNGLTSVAVVETDLEQHFCPQCGAPVEQMPGRKPKKFCCDICRNRWWNAHLGEVKRKAMYEYVCPTCGKIFYAYGNRHRKYCSHECYIADRFGGGQC